MLGCATLKRQTCRESGKPYACGTAAPIGYAYGTPDGFSPEGVRFAHTPDAWLSGKRQVLYLGRPQDRTGSPPALLLSSPSFALAQRTGASSRETLSAVAHGGNPQDRAASPRHCPPQPTLSFTEPYCFMSPRPSERGFYPTDGIRGDFLRWCVLLTLYHQRKQSIALHG
ncbi:hypothetical protein [Brasilonema bromeliae]|uniref:hypothetical protein n=1 Tax=Brasilonema bromeliae TaxID=383615 RepID=UPI001B7CDD6E|nr:hypothetical protein [Brasilonema bromeliae]